MCNWSWKQLITSKKVCNNHATSIRIIQSANQILYVIVDDELNAKAVNMMFSWLNGLKMNNT